MLNWLDRLPWTWLLVGAAWMAVGLNAPGVEQAEEMIRSYGERFIR